MNQLDRQVFNKHHPVKQWPNWKYCIVEQYCREIYRASSPAFCHKFIKDNQLKNTIVKFIR
jgi:hypothetical protein